MSSLVYPANLPGLKFDNERTPVFKTGVQPAASMKESRIAYALYPVFEFGLQYEFLRDNVTPSDVNALVGLFGAMHGRFDTFLFVDPKFNTVVDERFGTGDGVTQDFQLTAIMQNVGGPGCAELIQNLNGAPVIKKLGVVQGTPTDYTISGTGMVHFVGAPLAGEALTWSGSFYYRCRFDEDRLTTTEFMRKFWSTRLVKLRSVKL